MEKPDIRSLAVAERHSLLSLLKSLTPEQWRAPSLCTAWRVQEVAAHIVSYDELSWPGLGLAFVRGGFRVGSVNEVARRPFESCEPAEIVALVERHLEPRGLTAAMGSGIALTDGTIHQQDIRRALGLPRTIPEAQLRAVLDFALKAPTLPGKGNAKGLHLVACDLDWEYGDGAEVTGPGEALLMAVAGRPAALADLTGPGVEILAPRVTR